MKKKILFIINPISGTGKNRIVEKLIVQKLNRSIFDYEFVYTKAPKHATEMSRMAVNEGFEIVAAVGGDGSVNEVARSLIHTNSSLAILPCGSGNGTARHMKIPIDLNKAINIINRGKSKTIDTFKVNEEIAINTAGIGYTAHIAHKFSKLNKRGFKNYIKISIKDSLKYESQQCEILIDGKNWKGTAFIIDVANGNQWGNNAIIAPYAKNDDGFLDLLIVKDFPFMIFPIMAVRLFTKSIHRSKYVELKKITDVVIRQERNDAHIDGEPVMLGSELRVSILPLSLKVVAPE